jgi:hypothetical protein
MPNTQTISEVASQIAIKDSTEREKAIELHDYVRENVKFGFNKYFDAASPDYTLSCHHGHCNPKSALMVALFKAVGLESYQHFVVIPKDILKGAILPSRYWMIPAELSHSYVDVRVEGMWCSIDSFIVDTPLLKGAKDKLVQENLSLGYGVRVDSVNVWDGQSDAFSQFDKKMIIEDHGRIENPEAFFQDKRYRNVFLGIRFNKMFPLMGESGVAPMNVYIDRIRQ